MNSNVPKVPPPSLTGAPTQYKGLSWHKRPVPPPPININSMLADAPRTRDVNVVPLDEDAVKDAFITHVQRKYCYNPRCAKQCVITKMTPKNAFHVNKIQ